MCNVLNRINCIKIRGLRRALLSVNFDIQGPDVTRREGGGGEEIPAGRQFLYGARLYGVTPRGEKKERDRRAILFELESTALR